MGGTDYDRALSMAGFMPSFGYGSHMKRSDLEMPIAPFWDLSTWSSIHNLYEPKFINLLKSIRFEAQKPELLERLIHLVSERRCHSLLMEVEACKITLSDNATALSNLAWLEKNLQITTSRKSFEHSAEPQNQKLERTAMDCLKLAGIEASQVDVIFFTGGTSLIPSARETIMRAIPTAQVVNGDRFGAVGLGLGIEAAKRYG